MKLSEIKFEKDSFVESMVEKHPDLKAMREELSFWQRDPRKNLLGTWRSYKLPNVELSIEVEDNYFLLWIIDSSDIENLGSFHALLKGETDRLYYFVYKGKIVEIMITGDMDEDGEENGPEMNIGEYVFDHVEGTCAFVQETQAMHDNDEIGIAAMKYVIDNNENQE